MKKFDDSEDSSSARQMVEGIDFYFEGGLMVLTEKYLRGRGYCCDNGCRHCPYNTPNESYNKNVSSSSDS